MLSWIDTAGNATPAPSAPRARAAKLLLRRRKGARNDLQLP